MYYEISFKFAPRRRWERILPILTTMNCRLSREIEGSGDEVKISKLSREKGACESFLRSDGVW